MYTSYMGLAFLTLFSAITLAAYVLLKGPYDRYIQLSVYISHPEINITVDNTTKLPQSNSSKVLRILFSKETENDPVKEGIKEGLCPQLLPDTNVLASLQEMTELDRLLKEVATAGHRLALLIQQATNESSVGHSASSSPPIDRAASELNTTYSQRLKMLRSFLARASELPGKTGGRSQECPGLSARLSRLQDLQDLVAFLLSVVPRSLEDLVEVSRDAAGDFECQQKEVIASVLQNPNLRGIFPEDRIFPEGVEDRGPCDSDLKAIEVQCTMSEEKDCRTRETKSNVTLEDVVLSGVDSNVTTVAPIGDTPDFNDDYSDKVNDSTIGRDNSGENHTKSSLFDEENVVLGKENSSKSEESSWDKNGNSSFVVHSSSAGIHSSVHNSSTTRNSSRFDTNDFSVNNNGSKVNTDEPKTEEDLPFAHKGDGLPDTVEDIITPETCANSTGESCGKESPSDEEQYSSKDGEDSRNDEGAFVVTGKRTKSVGGSSREGRSYLNDTRIHINGMEDSKGPGIESLDNNTTVHKGAIHNTSENELDFKSEPLTLEKLDLDLEGEEVMSGLGKENSSSGDENDLRGGEGDLTPFPEESLWFPDTDTRPLVMVDFDLTPGNKTTLDDGLEKGECLRPQLSVPSKSLASLWKERGDDGLAAVVLRAAEVLGRNRAVTRRWQHSYIDRLREAHVGTDIASFELFRLDKAFEEDFASAEDVPDCLEHKWGIKRVQILEELVASLLLALPLGAEDIEEALGSSELDDLLYRPQSKALTRPTCLNCHMRDQRGECRQIFLCSGGTSLADNLVRQNANRRRVIGQRRRLRRPT